MLSFWQLPVLAATALYQAIACYREHRRQPPGQLINADGCRLHLLHLTSPRADIAKKPTVIIEHSLGGLEGYLLADTIAPLAEVCLCDRAGYGWSEVSLKAQTSEERVRSLDIALREAKVEPPYILLGNSLGSYHMRLYAHRFPEKVAGMVLTDGLHESALLNMPQQLRWLQGLFLAGFGMSVVGSALGFVRIAANLGLFEWIKPGLRGLPRPALQPVVRSFCRPQHWFTMAREIIQLDRCGQQLKVANQFGNLPIVNVKARYFFTPNWLMRWLPLGSIEQLRSQMHDDLMKLSRQCTQLPAERSSHFVWIDQPEVIVQAVQLLLAQTKT